MANKRQKKNLTICGLVLSAPGHDYFEFRCMICCNKAENSPVFSRWATLRIHVQKKHKNCIGIKLDDSQILENHSDSEENEEIQELVEKQKETIKSIERIEIEPKNDEASRFSEDLIIKEELQDNEEEVEMDLEAINDSNVFCADNASIESDAETNLKEMLEAEGVDLESDGEMNLKEMLKAEGIALESDGDKESEAEIDLKAELAKFGIECSSSDAESFCLKEEPSCSKVARKRPEVVKKTARKHKLRESATKSRLIHNDDEYDHSQQTTDSEPDLQKYLDMLNDNCNDESWQLASGDEDVENFVAEMEVGEKSVMKDFRDYSDVDGTNVIKSLSYKNGPSYKRICFNLHNNPVAIEFIQLLHETPAMWGIVGAKLRKTTFKHWIDWFQTQHNIHFTHDDLTNNLRSLRFYYDRILEKPPDADAAAEYVREQCGLLPERKRAVTLTCQYCDKMFKSKVTYQAHLFSKHGEGESPYKCELCNRPYTSAITLEFHIRNKHTNEFDIRCSICNKGFMTRSELVIHMPLHTGINRYICSTCGKSFRKHSNLRNHETRVHLKQRNFACTMCEKAFYTKSLLKDHINMHLGIKNFICPFCSKSFHSCHNLMRHKQIHSEVKKYTCKLCDAAFHQFVGLNAHMKKSHQAVAKNNDTESPILLIDE